MSSINREREAYENLLFAILEETFGQDEEFTLRQVYVEADELLFQAEEHGLDEPDVGIGATIRLAMKQLRNDGLIEGRNTYRWSKKTTSPPSSPPSENPLEPTWSNEAVIDSPPPLPRRKKRVKFDETVEEKVYEIDGTMRPHKSWKKEPVVKMSPNMGHW